MKRPSSTAIGAFVLGALALVASAILFFGGAALWAKKLEAVSYFDSSVAGLQIGAPVTFRGVRVGSVNGMGVHVNPQTYSFIIRVGMEIQPDTVATFGSHLKEGEDELIDTLLKRGLTAKLVMQSFVTGQLAVELDFRDGGRRIDVENKGHVPEIPTVPTDLQAITEQLQNVKLDKTVESLQKALDAVSTLLETPELRQTITELPALVVQLRTTLAAVETEVGAMSGTAQTGIKQTVGELNQTLVSLRSLSATLDKEVANTAAAARTTMGKADSALDGASAVLDPQGRTMVQMQRAVDDLAATAARLRNLSERVDRDPSVLIKGR
ncbi:MlaD family protein [Niveispirillum sp. SYP-B3756]|uniref:MlaD family protein n=1 Tax=Niveispirillum sp. SYP-B3756 TaxID=2662178 RepID=UPI00156535FE|nr:MlaD family protein [Niveispirillum sp. SYP-B3756]